MFTVYEACGNCLRDGEFGPVCQTCNRFADAYEMGVGVTCQPKGDEWSETVDWSEIYKTMGLEHEATEGGAEKKLPGFIKRFGGCTCRGTYDCISPAQNLRFSWRFAGVANISFDGCCPITVMDAFHQIGDLHMRMIGSPGLGMTAEQQMTCYKHIDCYWQHKAKILFLLKRHLGLGLWLARCAELAFVSADTNIALAKFKEVGTFAEKTGFQVLELLSTKGLGRVAIKQGDNQKALRLLVHSYNMLPFIQTSRNAFEVYKASGQHHLLEAMVRGVWENNDELSPWYDLMQMKTWYQEFDKKVCSELERERGDSPGLTPGLWEYRMLFCMIIKTTIAEHVEEKWDVLCAYIEVVKRGTEVLHDDSKKYFFTDIKLQMRDALQRVQCMTSVEEFTQIKAALLEAIPVGVLKPVPGST